MATSPPPSPLPQQQRPLSMLARTPIATASALAAATGPRSSSRMSMSSKVGGSSRASDEDSRTAVRVAVRVRPPLKPTDPGFELVPQRFQRSSVHVTSDTNIAIDSPQGKKLFVFDRVFGQDVMQDGIWSYLEDSVNSFVQGYNVSLLAYGQSGAGKSYTMGTSGMEQDRPEAMGVIPRAAYALFEQLDPVATKKASNNRASASHLRNPNPLTRLGNDKTWTLRATYLEIYNETLRDLLLPDSIPTTDRAAVTVREDTKGNILLTGLRQVDINSVDDLMNALSFGSSIRQTDATAVNAKSSRSHAVFTLNLVQRKPKANTTTTTTTADKRLSVQVDQMPSADAWVTTDSKLHFVDLAGSERLKNTGAQGERAKEGISINAGLAALGKVISQLSSRQAGSHVSYRDSKLTRLLQDSLGGNAITYMIACVTQAEFHLSETLNTVQYAQRARAIQSKPRIQQQTEEGDKQAIIDRLKAEVAFLRGQIHSGEGSGGAGGGGGGASGGAGGDGVFGGSRNRRNDGSTGGGSIGSMMSGISGIANGRGASFGGGAASNGDRRTLPTAADHRQTEREVELQNQLLDIQENYTTLSQRHAKLISEMAKARDSEAAANGDMDHSATERLERSNSFAQAVEQVVMEYEKTIQTLEQSLSSTRGTLSNTETSLLEKEAKCAYAETINNQLQTRLQKLMDREASTENYLYDLEAKLDGHTSGEEKNATIIVELRKEIARARENEASCEDYISTLEERLAEADQDAELMQREMDKMAQVIERQRSLGKLDSLLLELDQINSEKAGDGDGDEQQQQQQQQQQSQPPTATSAIKRRLEHTRTPSAAMRPSTDDIPEEESDEADEAQASSSGYATPSAQSHKHHKLVADKLEMVTQELVHLKVEHESTLDEFDALSQKYEDAMRSLAELQDAVDEARHPAKVRDSIISVAMPRQTQDKALAAELDLEDSLDDSVSGATLAKTDYDDNSHHDHHDDDHKNTGHDDNKNTAELEGELERLKVLADQHETAERELEGKYAELEDRHRQVLDLVEELRTEVHKARAAEASAASSPRSGGQPVIRRKSSQNVMIIDRAHRSFASLRNIATENFEDKPDVMASFELNINAAIHELHSRAERVQQLEADVAAAKKEMEMKMTIIAGLTRERSSIKAASPMDMTIVAGLREQLEMSEATLQRVRAAHEVREKELMDELQQLKEEKEVNENKEDNIKEDNNNNDDDDTIKNLQNQVSTWQSKHSEALEKLEAAEKAAQQQMERLEAEVATLNATPSRSGNSTPDSAASTASKQDTLIIKYLRNEIDEYRAIINSNATRIAELEQKHQLSQSAVEAANQSRDQAVAESDTSKELVVKLEERMRDLEQARKTHDDAMEQLRDEHAQETDKLKAAHRQEVDQIRTSEQHGYEQQMEVLLTEHAEAVARLEYDVSSAREELVKVAAQVAFALGVEASVEKISERIAQLAKERANREETLAGEAAQLKDAHDELTADLDRVRQVLVEVLHLEPGSDRALAPVGDHLDTLRSRMLDLKDENNRNSRIVQQLEEQLASNFDEAQATNNRLSTLAERNAKLEEVSAEKERIRAELDTVRDEFSALQSRYNEVQTTIQRDSMNPAVRKSSSVTSLPSSPPPSVPLPPLPGINTAVATASQPTSPTVSAHPHHAHHLRPLSKDQVALAQIQEDQEARIVSIEKSLKAEKTLNTVLEESLSDLERTSHKLKQDCDGWRQRAQELEAEIKVLRERAAQQPQQDENNRQSLLAERKRREDAEAARRLTEERMAALAQKKKKKTSLNCF